MHSTNVFVLALVPLLADENFKMQSDQSGTFLSAQSPIFMGPAIGEPVPLSMNSRTNGKMLAESVPEAIAGGR